jgi:adenosylmethionine-8-amino-7-oxononanoate aminotransferase
VQKVIVRDQLLAAVQRQGEGLAQRLQQRIGQHPNVGDLRGRGLFRGMEFVRDRATKQPFNPVHKLHAQIKAQAMAHGLRVYPMGGTLDGVHGDHLLLAPPYTVSDSELDAIVDRLAASVQAALAALPAEAHQA